MSGGVIEIDPQGLKVLVDEADNGDDIVEKLNPKPRWNVLSRCAKQPRIKWNLKKLLSIDRHAVRLKVADLRRRHRR